MLKVTAVLVGAAIGAGALFGLVASVTSPTTRTVQGTTVQPVSCPEEDSCSVDYDGVTNTWVITRVTP